MNFQDWYDYYSQKVNDVIIKCPIEFGVEIIVYNLLDVIIKSKDLSIVDINRIWKARDKRLTTNGGIPDIAILSKNFKYRSDIGTVYGFVEIKAPTVKLKETNQINAQIKSTNHYLYTNGIVWRYYKNGMCSWEKNLTSGNLKYVSKQAINIDENKFYDLIKQLYDIDWFNSKEETNC